MKILLLEDSPNDAELIEREIHRAGFIPRVLRVETKDGFASALQDFSPDLVLSDNTLNAVDAFAPPFDALAALSLTRQTSSDVGFIVVSGTVGEERAVELLRSGATDYVLKHRLDRLGPVIRRALAEAEQRRLSAQIEESARAANERFRSAFENAPSGMAVISLAGRFVQVNRTLRELLGRTQSSLLRSTVSAFTHPIDNVRTLDVFTRLLAGYPRVEPAETRFIRADGHTVWVYLGVSLLSDSARRPLYFIGQFVDITATKEAEAGRDLFLSHVSHELRAPLAVVHQFASLLLDETAGPLSTDQQEFLTVLMRNVGQLKAMIDDLLLAAQTERGVVAIDSLPIALRAVLVDTVADYRLLAEHRGVRLAADVGELPVVFADAERIREVLVNLLENGLRFTPEGGEIRIEAEAQGDVVRVSVRDTGSGICPEDAAHVFERFFQAGQGDHQARNGLGLGLYICRDLIERQGGSIWIESTLGVGTTVAFTVPILTSDALAQA
ncbi:sensor histidine kinase [Pengzhenrongella sp.]|uniref:sensor histidine kinase n=1 Tax=Pengzhenrongella sp. TaxID=2888820 RepID=UPI002F94DA86